MAETYETEEEQIEALKKWWRENGKSTVMAIVVAIAGVFGWQGWQQQQQAETEAVSALYQNLLQAVSGAELSSEQKATASHLAETIKSDYPATSYAQFAAFYKAKMAVQAGDLDAATTELNWVLANSETAEFRAQASLRLARVELSKQQYETALAALNVEALAYAASFAEVKGDIYLAQGKAAEAKRAYQESKRLNSEGETPASNPLLELKLQQLTGVDA